MNPDFKRKRAILFIKTLVRERLAEQEKLCVKYPQYAEAKILPDGRAVQGGMLDDLEVLQFAITLIDELT